MARLTQLCVLHALRLKSFVEAEVIAEMIGVDASTMLTELNAMADDELIRHKQGAVSGWLLLPAGRRRGEELLKAELDDSGRRDELEALYRRFLQDNQPFLSLCTEWQTRTVEGEVVRNDHGDSDYDAAVIGRLSDVEARMQPLWQDLGQVLERFMGYGPRFAAAQKRLTDGDIDWFTSPSVDSYHTVWFELHEDLLATLGIERAKEVQT